MTRPYGICWDLGDVIFSEDTEVKSDAGVTQRVTLVPGIGELIRLLAERGVPMAIISDTKRGACENVLAQHGLEDCFAHRTISEELGVEKPDEAMFVTTCEALKIPSGRLVMVGNHYYRDFEGARAVGMMTIWFHWNDRYPSPKQTPAAGYVARDASQVRSAIDDWVASLDAGSRSGSSPPVDAFGHLGPTV